MSTASLFITLVALFRAAHLRQAEALFDDTDPSSPASKLLKHKKNHERMSRTINGIYAGLAVAAAECVPLGSTVMYSSMSGPYPGKFLLQSGLLAGRPNKNRSAEAFFVLLRHVVLAPKFRKRTQAIC